MPRFLFLPHFDVICDCAVVLTLVPFVSHSASQQSIILSFIDSPSHFNTFYSLVLGFRRWLFAGLILAVLVSVLLYQLFAPGTALRYYRCRQGSIDNSDLWFTFTTNDLQVFRLVRTFYAFWWLQFVSLKREETWGKSHFSLACGTVSDDKLKMRRDFIPSDDPKSDCEIGLAQDFFLFLK